MTELNKIRDLETTAIFFAKRNIPEAMTMVIVEMEEQTAKFLGLTNEYKEDLKEESPDLNWGRKD